MKGSEGAIMGALWSHNHKICDSLGAAQQCCVREAVGGGGGGDTQHG